MREGARPAHRAPLLDKDGIVGETGGGTPPLLVEGARSHRGWYTPRRLPHFDSPEVVQAITFRLADALPRAVASERAGAVLDRGYGACLLRDPARARIVEAALLHGADTTYALLAFVVMPNHVHALIAPRAGQRLPEIVGGWKSWSAKAINRHRGAAGRVWQREYFDRFMRDEAHVAATIAYIEDNPVKAGLCARADAWRFSSAWEGARPAHPALALDNGSEGDAMGGGTPPLQDGGETPPLRGEP